MDVSNIEALFIQALSFTSKVERDTFIEKIGRDQPELKAQVEGLLQGVEEASLFFEDLSSGVNTVLEKSVNSEKLIGKTIGDYRLTELIGQGGMSTVYKAERVDGHFQHEVVFKVLSGFIGSDYAKKAFQEEQQILASLNHPNIGRLYNGGILDDERPYIVMEYVDGLPIDSYCRDKKLSQKEILKLFLKVIAAVHHAHQKLILHQDIKPHNILITAEGDLKLLDFGIGRRVSETSEAGFKGLYGTPGFISPEQLLKQSISTSSDIYQLGVLLYLLLTSELPFDPERDIRHHLTELIIKTPEVPSAKSPAKKISKEMDAIILKALQPKPAERYSSVEALMKDISSLLSNKTVEAFTGGRFYPVKKYMQRNRVGVSLGGLALFFLLGGILFSSWQARIADHERKRAEGSLSLMKELFINADPFKSSASLKEMKVFDFLEGKKETLLTNEGISLDEKAEFLNILFDTYLNARLQEEAYEVASLMDSLALYHERHDLSLDANIKKGAIYVGMYKFREAIELLSGINENIEKISPEQAGNLLLNLAKGYHLNGVHDSAEIYYQKAFAHYERNSKNEISRKNYVNALNSYAQMLRSTNQYEEAEKYTFKTIKAKLETADDSLDVNMCNTYSDMALIYMEQEKLPEADAYFQLSIKSALTKLDSAHNYLEVILGNYVILKVKRGEYEFAGNLAREILEKSSREKAEDHIDLIFARLQLGMALIPQRKFKEADSLLARGLESANHKLGESHMVNGNFHIHLSKSKLLQKDYANTLVHGEKALSIFQEKLPEGHHRIGLAKIRYGRALAATTPSQGIALIEEGLRILRESKAPKAQYVKEGEQYLRDLVPEAPGGQ